MWSSGSAAVGVITKLMNVHSSLRIGIVAGDVVLNGGRVRIGGLLEDNSAGDLGVTTQNSHYLVLMHSVSTQF